MSKRVALTMADVVFSDLERWSEQQGRPVANLANFLVEKAIADAKESGELLPVAKKRTRATKQ
jgi:hypothetical protein